MPDYRIDPYDYLQGRRSLAGAQRVGQIAERQAARDVKAAAQPQPSLAGNRGPVTLPNAVAVLRGQTPANNALPPQAQSGPSLLQRLGAGLGHTQLGAQAGYQGAVDLTSQGIESGINAVNLAGSEIAGGYRGVVNQPQQPLETTPAVNAGRDAGTGAPPQTLQAFQPYQLPRYQTASPQEAALLRGQQNPSAVQLRPNTFSGADTNAQTASRLADYSARGLDIYGNDQRAIAQLTQRANQQEQARLGRNEQRAARREAVGLDAQRQLALDRITRAGFDETADAQRLGALAAQTLSGIPQESAQGRLAQVNQQQRGAQAQTLAQALQSQQQAQADQARFTQEQQQKQQAAQDTRQQAAYDRIVKAYQSGIEQYTKQIDALGLGPERETFLAQYPTAEAYANQQVQNVQAQIQAEQQQQAIQQEINARGEALKAQGLTDEQIKAQLRQEFFGA